MGPALPAWLEKVKHWAENGFIGTGLLLTGLCCDRKCFCNFYPTYTKTAQGKCAAPFCLNVGSLIDDFPCAIGLATRRAIGLLFFASNDNSLLVFAAILIGCRFLIGPGRGNGP